MKRNSSLLLILFGIVLIIKTSFEIYQDRPGKFTEKEIDAIVGPIYQDSCFVIINEGDYEIAKAYLRKIK